MGFSLVPKLVTLNDLERHVLGTVKTSQTHFFKWFIAVVWEDEAEVWPSENVWVLPK